MLKCLVDLDKRVRQGGPWLRAVRKYLQQNVRGGDRCTWGSDELLTLSVSQIEELAAKAVVADRLNKIRAGG
jgi:hypothetical protein